MSKFLDKYIAREAIDIVQPTIEKFLGSSHTGKENDSIHIVVLNPGTEDILFEESLGADKSTWNYPYDEIARSKARICQRTGMVGRDVQVHAPWHYESGDTRYVGGVYENGLVVAASGIQDHYDEMFAWMVVSAIQGLCRDSVSLMSDNAPNFFG